MKRAPTDPALACCYVRVSTDSQDLGPDAQRAQCARWAATNGTRIVSTHSDLGVSGAAALADRPGLLAAIEALRANGAGVLLVAKRDRLARDVIVSAMVERLIEREGARVLSADGSANATGPEGGLFRNILSAFAEYERHVIAARTRAALAVKRSRGERLGGHTPYGYVVAPDGVHLLPCVGEALIVDRIHALRASGLSLRSIGAALLAEGLRPRCGKVWFASTIAGILAAEKFSVPTGTMV